MGTAFVNTVLERVEADTVEGVDETLLGRAVLDIDLDDLIDDVSHFAGREGRADHLTQLGIVALAAAQRDLVELGIVLVYTEHADVADFVVSAGVHAARDVEIDLADVEQVIEVVETGLDGIGDGDGFGVGQVAEVAARAADDAGQQADVWRGQTGRLGFLPDFVQVALLDVGQDDVLLVADAQFAEAVAVVEVSHHVHLVGSDVARCDAVLLQRQGDGLVAGYLVGVGVAFKPALESLGLRKFHGSNRGVAGRGEVGGDAVVFLLRDGHRTTLAVGPFGLDLLAEGVDAECLHQNLDAGLVGVVAAAVAVIDAQDGLAVGEDVLPGQEVAHDLAADRGTAKAAADDDGKADLAINFLEVQADVVEPADGAVFAGAGNGDLELAWQEGEFRVEGRPLTHDLGERARVDDFIGRYTGELVGGDVAQAVAGGLDGVHVDFGQLGQDLGYILDLRT